MAAAAPGALDCWGALEEPALTGVVSTALGRPVTLAGFRTVEVPYQVGLVHAGELPVAALPEVHAVLVPAFTEGLRAGGGRATADQVAFGYVASLAVRAGFTSLPFERLGEPPTPELTATFAQRAALTRFVVDLGLALR